jgi:hypothetical protein
MSVREALTTADLTIKNLIPQTIESIILEAAEPEYLASPFFTKISLNEGRSIEIVNFGALRASEIAEGGNYPEQQLNAAKFGGKFSTEVKVKKYGLLVNISDEMISDSQWDVIGMHLRAAGRAMARAQEEACFYEMSQHGHVIYDCDLAGTIDGDGHFTPNGTAADLAPTGRGWDGFLNGTLTVEDFIAMMTSIMASGFRPTDVLMHPLCYSLFLANQDLATMFAGMAAFGGGGSTSPQLAVPAPGTYAMPMPGLRLQFSPYVPFDEVAKKFDVYVLDRNNVGVIVEKDPIAIEQFDNPLRDIQSLKIRARWGVGILNGGLGICVAKNVQFKKTYTLPGRLFAAMPMPTDTADMDNINVRQRTL